MHTIWIIAHAATATIALVCAVLALKAPRLVAAHAAFTIAMAATLVPALWLGRTDNPLALSLVFLGLLGLAVVMSYRGWRAWRVRPRPGQPLGPQYIAAVGFNVIGLVTGFVTVSVLRLGWGTIAVVVAAVTIPAAGHYLLDRAKESARATIPG